MRLPDRYLVHTVTVHPYAGKSSTSAVYGEPFQLKCMAQGGLRIVKGADGSDKLAPLTLYAAPGQAATVPPLSLVEHNGATATVLVAIDHDSGGLGAPDHTEVVCE